MSNVMPQITGHVTIYQFRNLKLHHVSKKGNIFGNESCLSKAHFIYIAGIAFSDH